MFEIKQYIDPLLREIEEVIIAEGVDADDLDTWPEIVPGMETGVPGRDFRFFLCLEQPMPVGQMREIGLPIFSTVRLRIPMVGVETISDAFSQYDSYVERLNQETQKQNTGPKLVIAKDIPNA